MPKRTTRLNGVRLPAGARDLLAYLAICEDAKLVPNLTGMGRAIHVLRDRHMIGRSAVKTNAKGRRVLARLQS